MKSVLGLLAIVFFGVEGLACLDISGTYSTSTTLWSYIRYQQKNCDSIKVEFLDANHNVNFESEIKTDGKLYDHGGVLGEMGLHYFADDYIYSVVINQNNAIVSVTKTTILSNGDMRSLSTYKHPDGITKIYDDLYPRVNSEN